MTARIDMDEDISKYLQYKYLRIQGMELDPDTMQAKGVFSLCWRLVQEKKMDQEDEELYLEIDKWIGEELPYPQCCLDRKPVICFFKTENAGPMLKMIRPALWLLERYEEPYYLVLTNTPPGRIVYEDQYQIAVEVDGKLVISAHQKSWPQNGPTGESWEIKEKNE